MKTIPALILSIFLIYGCTQKATLNTQLPSEPVKLAETDSAGNFITAEYCFFPAFENDSTWKWDFSPYKITNPLNLKLPEMCEDSYPFADDCEYDADNTSSYTNDSIIADPSWVYIGKESYKYKKDTISDEFDAQFEIRTKTVDDGKGNNMQLFIKEDKKNKLKIDSVSYHDGGWLVFEINEVTGEVKARGTPHRH